VVRFRRRGVPKAWIPLALRDESCPHAELEWWQGDVVEEPGELLGGHPHISKCLAGSSARYRMNRNGKHTHRASRDANR
jgi:hypothetical protein